jgi:hypothetical protein
VEYLNDFIESGEDYTESGKVKYNENSLRLKKGGRWLVWHDDDGIHEKRIV